MTQSNLDLDPQQCFFNSLIFIKNKRRVRSSEGFSTLERNVPSYVLRGQCCLSSRVWQPSAHSNGSLGHFFLSWTLLGWVRQPAAKLPLVATTPVANFSTSFFNLPPVTTILAANCHRYQWRRRQICHWCKRHWWQTMGTIIKLLTN